MSHLILARGEGAHFSAALLRAMAVGLYSFLAFCFVLAVVLEHADVQVAFAVAAMASLAVQAATKRHLTPPSSGLPAAAAHVER
jgi:hypothetical protein